MRFGYLLIILSIFLSTIINGQKGGIEYDDSYRYVEEIIIADSILNIWQWEKAINVYKKAKYKFKKEGNWPGFYYTQNQIAYIKREQNKYDLCLSLVTETIAEGSKILGPNHPEIARAYYVKGFYYMYGTVTNLDSSYIASTIALDKRSEKPIQDNIALADSYQQLGDYYKRAINPILSKENHSEAIRIYQQEVHSFSPKLAYAYFRYALSLALHHDTFRALNYLLKAKDIYDHQNNNSDILYSRISNNIANKFHTLGQLKESIPYYQYGIKRVIKKEGAHSIELLGKLSNLSATYIQLNEIDSAKIHLDTCLEIIRKNKNQRSAIFSWVYEQLALLHEVTHEIDSAIHYTTLALNNLALISSIEHDFISSLMETKARRFLKINQIDSSKRYIQESLKTLVSNFSSDDFYQNPSINNSPLPDILFQILETKAKVHFQVHKSRKDHKELQSSILLYNKMDSLTDILRELNHSTNSKIFLSKYYKASAGDALEILKETDNYTSSDEVYNYAFKFMEKNRYAKIYQNQSKRSDDINVDLFSDSLNQKENNYQTQLNDLERKIKDYSDQNKKDSIRSIKFNVTNDFVQFQNKVSRDYPTYSIVKHNKHLSLAEVQERLGDNSQIIEYFWSDTVIYILTIANDIVLFNKEIISHDIQDSLRTFLKILSHHHDIKNHNFDIFKRYSHHLYRKFVSAYVIPEKTNLILSRDGPLSYLPFETLLTSNNCDTWKQGKYLLNSFDIQYTYSSNLLFMNQRKERPTAPSILAMSYSDLENSSNVRINDYDLTSRGHNLSEIPWTSQEVEAIQILSNNSSNILLKGIHATESAFKKEASKHHIIHLAVHGRGNQMDELKSSLFFKNDRDMDNDGVLNAYELYNMRLGNTELVVLSACESGIGKDIKGEGIFSIERGFAYAGAPTIVMSLWNIEDNRTSKIIVDFYNNLYKGNEIHVALNQAKRTYIENTEFDKEADPYYWAGLIQLGKTTPIIKKSMSWIVFIIITIASIFGGLLLYKNKLSPAS